MRSADSTHSWFSPPVIGSEPTPTNDPREFERLWLGFMTARATLGLALLLLQTGLYRIGQIGSGGVIAVCAAYFLAALGVRLGLQPRRLRASFDPHWLLTIVLDCVAFSALQLLQGSSNINYTPLFALPVLLASVLGPQRLALATATSITLLLLSYALWLEVYAHIDAVTQFVQTGLIGIGCFVIAFLVPQLAARLAREEDRARRNQLAARIQVQVNDLVIESISDGILVVDGNGTVHAANPAARQMLRVAGVELPPGPFSLSNEPSWQPLVAITQEAFLLDRATLQNLVLQDRGLGSRHLRVRTRMTAQDGGDDGMTNLCVMFLQDQREMEARMRTEKLASMGRMSAAVAHEIRNPLAAIAQANALLQEDLIEPRYQQLTQIVQQNASRLEKIVDEVLNIARVKNQGNSFESQLLDLNDTTKRVCHDWVTQTQSQKSLHVQTATNHIEVDFDPDHLRRVLVNLLDNARRYASQEAQAIQVSTRRDANGLATLNVWSDSPPMESSVEQHLFEPFFSSESRSSGLGLYICRELCEGHSALIAHQRSRRIVGDRHHDGNEFFVTFQPYRAPTS